MATITLVLPKNISRVFAFFESIRNVHHKPGLYVVGVALKNEVPKFEKKPVRGSGGNGILRNKNIKNIRISNLAFFWPP